MVLLAVPGILNGKFSANSPIHIHIFPRFRV